MKVLLLQNVPKLGKQNEVKDVAAGFARNYLFPRELARPVQENELEELQKQRAKQQKRAEKELKRAQELADRLEGLEIEVPTKVSSQGEAYKALSEKKIADVLQAMGYDVTKENIITQDPIKHVGEHMVKISFNDGIETTITVVLLDRESLPEEDDKKENGDT